MLAQRPREAGAREELRRVAIVLRRRPGHDLLEGDGELVRVERAAFADFLARRGDLVPGFHGDPPTVSACGRTGRPPVFQAREVGIGHGREAALSGVHPVADAVGDDHVARKPERLHVALGLIERALDARAQALGLDHEVAVLRRAGQRPEHRHVDVAPFDGDPFRRPAERAQERHHEVRDQLVLARVLAEGLAVLEQRHEIGGLGDDALQGAGHLIERRLLGGQVRERGRLPVRRRRLEEPLREVHDLLVPHPRAARRVGAEDRAPERVLRGQAAPAHAPRVLQVPAVHVVEGVHVQVVARHEAHCGDRRECRCAAGTHPPPQTSLAKRRTKPPSNSPSSRSGAHGPASPGPISATPCLRKTSAYDRDAGPPEICQTARARSVTR